MSRGTWILIAISVVLGSASCGKSEKQPPAVESAQAKKSADSNPGQLLPIAVGGKFGYIDTAGKFVISPKFSDGREFKDGLALVAEGGTPEKPDRRYGFIDHSGKFVIAPQFDDAGEFSQGLAAVMVGGVESSWGKTQGRWGFVDKNGKFVVNPQFDYVGEFGENSLAPVQVIDQSSNESESIEQWGYIDRSGKILIQPQFQWASGFNEGLAVVRIAEVGAVAGAKGSRPTTRAPSKKKAVTLDQYGLIDTTGQFAFPGRFNHALSFSEGLAAVDVDGKWGFIDRTGKFVLSPMFAMAGSFKDGLAPVRTDKKSNVGYIDKTGHFVIAPQFDEGNEFSEGRAAVRIGAPPQKGEWEFLYLRKRSGLSATKGNKVGFVDKSGSLVINPQFTFASVFQHGVAQVEWADGIDGWIDSTGTAIYDPRSQMSPPGSDKSANSKNANAATRIAGSAFFVSEEGHMLTNYHIGGDCKDILIPSLSGSAQFLHGDSINDLALLRSNKKPVGTVAVFRRSDDIEQGEHVILYGYPLSGVLASDGNISSGQISALVGLANNVSQLQISAPVQPGNSGGPLIDGKGRIIGVVVSKLSAVKVAAVTGDIPQNVNFAINLRTTKAFLDSQKIKYETSSIFARDKSDEDIAARAREFTFAVECIK